MNFALMLLVSGLCSSDFFGSNVLSVEVTLEYESTRVVKGLAGERYAQRRLLECSYCRGLLEDVSATIPH